MSCNTSKRQEPETSPPPGIRKTWITVGEITRNLYEKNTLNQRDDPSRPKFIFENLLTNTLVL